MPQPDNKRTRGKNLGPMQGSVIAPEGTSGVYNVMGVSNNVAANQKISGLQIGQQGRIIDDGSGLYRALQGGFEGVERGVQQYDKWSTKIAEKRQNDWETELSEYGRSVNGNPKKMAEWSRLSEYRPNQKMAKRYNQLMADMEGKEYDAYQDDLIVEVTQATSKMDMPTASRYINERMSQLDPTDKAYKSFAGTQNTINERMTALSANFDQGNQEQTFKTGMYNLGEMLRTKAGVTAGDLANDRATTVGSAYNFFGQDADKMLIKEDGSIMYRADDGTVFNESFHGGLTPGMISAMEADMGNAPYGDNGEFNPTIARNVESAMSTGAFNRQHTARGSGGSQELQLDAVRGTLRSTSMSNQSKRGALFAAVSSEQLKGDPDKQRTHTLKVLNELVDGTISSGDPAEQRVGDLENMLVLMDPENGESLYTLNGFEGDVENNSDINGLMKKIREEINTINFGIAKDVSRTSTTAIQNSLSVAEMRDTRKSAVFEMMRRLDTQGDSSTHNVINFDGTNVYGVKNIEKFLVENPDALISGTVQIVSDVPSRDIGGGIWTGRAGVAPPEKTTAWATQQRNNLKAVENVEMVMQAVQNPNQQSRVNSGDAMEAVNTIISKMPSDPLPSSAAPAIDIIRSPRWTREDRGTMTSALMSNTASGNGRALQQIFSIGMQEAWQFANLPPESVQSALDGNDPEAREAALQYTVVSSLASTPETSDFAAWLSGDPNGNVGWYLTDGRKYVAAYREYHNGEEPTQDWLKKVKNFDLMPAFRQQADTTVNTLLGMSAATRDDNFKLVTSMRDPNNNTPEIRTARELQTRWNASAPEGQRFLEILAVGPDNPDYVPLQNWMRNQTSRFTSAMAITQMMDTEAYGQHAMDRQRAQNSGQELASPEMSGVLYNEMMDAALRSAGPPTFGLLTVEKADMSTTPSGDYGNTENLLTQDQANVHGIKYIMDQVATRDNAVEGDVSMVLSQLGVDSLGLDGQEQAQFYRLYRYDPSNAREFLKFEVDDFEDRFNLFEEQLSRVFIPRVDYAANASSKDVSTANFRVEFNPKLDRSNLDPQTLGFMDYSSMNDAGAQALKFSRRPPKKTENEKVK